MTSSEDEGGPSAETGRSASVRLPIDAWRWWLRIALGVLLTGGAALQLMEIVPLIAVFITGILFGILLDRFVLWPIAVLLARVDDRVRRR